MAKKIWKQIDQKIDQLAQQEAESQPTYDAIVRLNEIYDKINQDFNNFPLSLYNQLYPSFNKMIQKAKKVAKETQKTLGSNDQKIIPTIMLAENQLEHYHDLLKSLAELPDIMEYKPYIKARKESIKAIKKAGQTLCDTFDLILTHTSEELSYLMLKAEDENNQYDQYSEAVHQSVKSAKAQYQAADKLNRDIQHIIKKVGENNDKK